MRVVSQNCADNAHRVWRDHLEPANDVQPRAIWQAQIDQRHVPLALLYPASRLAHGPGLAHPNIGKGFLCEIRKPGQGLGHIFDDEQCFNIHGDGVSSGRRAKTWVPLSDEMVKAPPCPSARAAILTSPPSCEPTWSLTPTPSSLM